MRPFRSGSNPTLARLIPRSKWGVDVAPRRMSQGAGLSGEVSELRQPQDGAEVLAVSNVEQMPSPLGRGSMSRLIEPEDASMTGATRSLGRRLLGLNVASRPKPVVRELGRTLLSTVKTATVKTQVA